MKDVQPLARNRLPPAPRGNAGTGGGARRRRLRPEDLMRCDSAPVAWAAFDPEWYLAAYPEIRAEVNDRSRYGLLQFYLTFGQGRGHSPNMLFDESWYLAANPDARALIEAGKFRSGFDHYCALGHRDRSPHWLFDDVLYRTLNPELAGPLPGIFNRYDHFLRHGAGENRRAHILFDPLYYCEHTGEPAGNASPFVDFLRRIHLAGDEVETCIYFDAGWYRYRYPEVDEAIRAGRWLCALHHYVRNDAPQRFDPLSHFWERFYRENNPDILPALAAGTLRSGYQHFLFHGVFELRAPTPFVDLGAWRPVDGGAGARDAFAHFLGRCRTPPAASPADERQAQALFTLRAHQRAAHVARRKPDFRCDGVAEVSVIVVARDRFAMTMNALGSLRSTYPGAIELMVVDSGSTDETCRIASYIEGALVLRHPSNVGFVRGCNTALAHVSAPAVLFLNNDVELAPGALAAALARLDSDPAIGAVGGKVVRTHGLLQEAGAIIWRDGHASGYLRDAPADSPEADFVRDVDYCSGAFLLVRASALRALGGFDAAFAPAYYEDADLCVRLWQHGFRVVYDPAVQLTHYEYGSAASAEIARAMMRQNQRVFAAKHRGWLRRRYARDAKLEVFARSAGKPGYRVLFLEDTVPLRGIGSGYVRANDLVRSMVALGCAVTVFPVNGCRFDPARVFADLPDTVEVMRDRNIAHLPDFLAERRGYYDAVWVSRAHNLDKALPALQQSCGDPNRADVILDTEAVFSLRDLARVSLTGAAFDLDAALAREFANLWFCQRVVAVSETEAELLRLRLGLADVAVLGTAREPAPTLRRFEDRSGLLFVGAVHGADSPTYDALGWFIEDVLPLLRRRIGEGARLTVAGYAAPGAGLRRWRGRADIELLGEVADLRPLYDRHRVFVAPTRYAAGTPYKVYEAAGYGLPVVASELLARQLGWSDGIELGAAEAANPARFAERVAALYRSPRLWQAVRAQALGRLAEENAPARFRERLAQILGLAPPCARPALPACAVAAE